MKKGSADAERLRMERTEIEKRIKTELDDTRWLPLCDWYALCFPLLKMTYARQVNPSDICPPFAIQPAVGGDLGGQ